MLPMNQPPKPKRDRLCAYCGVRPGTTKDHIVPRALFEVMPLNAPTVKACKECNLEKSQYDQFLRDYLVMDWSSGIHPTAKAKFAGPVSRAGERNQSELLKYIDGKIELTPFYTKNGIYLGDNPSAKIPSKPLNEALGFIVRGCAYFSKGHRIPLDFSFEIGRMPDLQLSDAMSHLLKYRHKKRVATSDGDFVALSVSLSDFPDAEIWLLGFYKRAYFTVAVMPPEAAAALAELQAPKDYPY